MIGRILSSQGGFTMIEMTTVMIVIITLGALVIVSTHVSDRHQQLRDAASGYVSAARDAESLASSSQAVPDPDQGNQPTSRKAYGVCITSSQIANTKCNDPNGKTADMYQIYARDVDETSPDVEASLVNRPDQPEIISSFKLPKDFSFLDPNIWVDYVPPAPTLFSDGRTTNSQALIRYKTKASVSECAGSPDCKFIQIRPQAGAVYVQ